jgi:hypothetical protein
MEPIKENIYRIYNIEDIKRFLIGGQATITLESKKTNRWFTYKIKSHKDNESIFFVSVLTGTDNESNYTYIGTIFNNLALLPKFKLTKNSKISETSSSFVAFNYFFINLINNRLHPDLAVYHNGVCCCCGRTITTPESLKTGIGPFCASRYQKS